MQENAEKFAEIAAGYGFVTPPQLRAASRAQARVESCFGRRPPLAEVLLVQGIVDPDQVQVVFQAIRAAEGHGPDKPPGEETVRRRRVLLGQLAVERGLITEDQLLRCLGIQQEDVRKGRMPRPLGAILGAEGLLSKDQLQGLLREQYGLEHGTAPPPSRARPQSQPQREPSEADAV